MSHAFKITTDDVDIVLKRNNIHMTCDEVSKIHDGLDFDKIDDVVLTYVYSFNQINAALNEIERQLIEDGVIIPQNETKEL